MNSGNQRFGGSARGWILRGRPGPLHLAALATVVALAALLGAHWLRSPLLGLPVGVWFVALGFALMRRFTPAASQPASESPARSGERADPNPSQPPPGDRRHDLPSQGESEMIRLAHRTSVRGSVGPAFAAASPAIAAAADLARSLGPMLARHPDRFESCRDAAIHRLDTLPWPTAPIRIGLDLPWAFAENILNAPGCAHVRFQPVDPAADDRAILDRQGLDAILRQTDAGPTRIVTPDAAGRDAAWFDWARPTPLSYASVFPARIDPQLVTFSGLTRVDPRDARTIRLLVEAAALLARTPARLGLTDRLRGRRPIDFRLDRWHGAAIEAHVKSLHDAMRELGKIVCDSTGDSPSPALAAAARAVSAWYVTADWLACEQIRRKVVEAAARVLPHEPEPALRAVAVEFADLDDDAAMQTVVHAERVMRQHAHLAVADTGAFLQSEIDCGVAGPLTVGRVAAGICMLSALTDPDRLQFLRQDLAEDLRFAPWLIGRDADARVLIEVARTIERAHGRQPALTLDTAA